MPQTNPSGWIPADQAWIDWVKAHPEFGAKPTINSWIHFQRTHAKALIEADVIRRIAFRGRMIADTSRFDAAAFNLLTTGSVEGKNAERVVARKESYEIAKAAETIKVGGGRKSAS